MKTLKIFLIGIAVLILVFLIFGVVLVLDWPWWVGFFFLVGFVGLWLGFVFLRRLWLRNREQQFVNEVIEQDESYLNTLKDKEKERLKELQDRWKEAINALRASHLKKYGNPLYVLPWYLVIGESGSGKTTAIKSAHLASPFAEISKTSGISGTRNCDWWFFDQAVIIDTAGRYAIPVDEGKDKEEWRNFLGHLSKFRKKEPVNGLVVTVSADKLLEQAPETLEEDGRNIRRRMDELMRVLGAKFPVYLLVTKCDLIQGMTQFSERLPDGALAQAMGFINNDLSKDLPDFCEKAIYAVGERLRDIRLLLLHEMRSKAVDPGLLLFPEEFERLKPGLNGFARGAFKENPYQETPFLRGAYFSSGRQEGSPYSHFLKALGLIEEKEVLPVTDKGLFLHDFFSRILPKDRRLFAPTQRNLAWGRLTRSVGLSSWVAFVFALCGLLSFSFVKNLSTLRDVSHEFATPPVLQGELVADVTNTDRFRSAVSKVENLNRNWWVPRLGLNQSKDVEAKLKAKYCRQVGSGLITPLDKRISETTAGFSAGTPLPQLVSHLDHIIKRIKLLRARLQGEDFKSLQSMSQPSFEPDFSAKNQQLLSYIDEKYANVYLHYLSWQGDTQALNRELIDLQTYLKYVLTTRLTDLRWIVQSVNANPSLSGVKLGDFWGGSLTAPNEVAIPPAFTSEGKGQVDAFLKEIESALSDPLIILSQKKAFEEWYRKSYIQAWHVFGVSFPKGALRLQGRKEWRSIAAIMTTDKGPYGKYLDRMAEELSPFGPGEGLSSWMKRLYAIQALRLQAMSPQDVENRGVLAKAREMIAGLEKKTGAVPSKTPLDAIMAGGNAFRQYRAALAETAPAAQTQKIAFDMAAKVFSEDHAINDSPFVKAQKAYLAIKSSLENPGSDEKMIWDLMAGPMEFLWDFVCRETACALQDLWEKKVLVEVQGVSDERQLTRMLLGEEGFAVKFVKGPASPFVGRSVKRGFYPMEALGRAIPFNDAFFAFFTQGLPVVRSELEAEPPPKEVLPSEYVVQVRALPTDVNKGAQIIPHATRLEVRCGIEATSLINLQYPVQKSFRWLPQGCSEVVFQIEVGNLILKRNYKGDLAFPRFLEDFAGGQRVFKADDFPLERDALKRLGIEFIEANYEFRGHEPVLKLLKPAPVRKVARIPKLPGEITRCWGR